MAARQNSDQPQVAFGDDGTAIAVWVRNDGTSNIVQAAIRPPGGAFGAGVDLSQAGENAGSPQVAFAPDGTATVIWSRLNGTHYIVQAATRPPGGAFGDPVDLSATGQSALNAQIAVADDGTATVVWWRSNGTNKIIQATTRPPGGNFGLPVDLSATGQDAETPQIAFAQDRTATVVWRRSNGTNTIVQAVTRPPGGAFGDPVDLSATGQSALFPQVAVAQDRTATVVWRRSNGTNTIVQAVTRPPGGAFGDPVDLSATGQNADAPQIAFAPDGTATVVWSRSDGSNSIVQAATRPPGEAFGMPVDLTATGYNAENPHIAFAPDSTATALWRRFNGTDYIVQAVTRPPGGAFGAPVSLSAAGQTAEVPQLAVAVDGSATAVWNRWSGSNYIIQSASTAQPTPLLQVSRTGTGSGSVSSSPAGIACGEDCAETYPSFTKVTLTASSSSGSVFAGWSGGGCSGTGTCQVTMLGATQVTAEFERTKAKLGRLKIIPKAKKLRAGKAQRVKVKVTNLGDGKAQSAKVCVKAPKRLVKVKKCVKLGGLAAGASKKATFKAKLTRKAKPGKKVKLTFTATAQGIAKRTGKAVLTRRNGRNVS